MNLKKTISAAAIASLAMAASPSHAATILSLTGDIANSSAGAFSTSFADTLSDPFLYDPDSPTSTLPAQGSASVVTGGWHGDMTSGNHLLSYVLAGGAITTGFGSDTIYLDFYGRSNGGDPLPGVLLRDNNYTVTLYNGDYTTQISQVTGQGVADVAPYFNRSTFNLGSGVTFDRIQITSPGSSSDPSQYFTVMEIRAAAVPETSAALLCSLGTLGLLRRRRLA